MKKIIEEVKKIDGKLIKRITVADERFYINEIKNPITGLPELKYIPSVTWICGFYPKGIAFYKWLADKGWNEAESIKSSAGDKGSKVHCAVTELLNGKEVSMEDAFLNPTTEATEPLTLEEYECLMAFADWYNSVKPKVLNNEVVVISDKYGYAGTVDIVCEIEGETYIVDIKTGQYVWPEYELQLSAYQAALGKPAKLAILQIGYKRNKNAYKFTEIENKFDCFKAAMVIWKNENINVRPKVKDYPLLLSLNLSEGKKSEQQKRIQEGIQTNQRNKTKIKSRTQNEGDITAKQKRD